MYNRIKILSYKFLIYLNNKLSYFFRKKILFNVNKINESDYYKRVLFVYLTKPFKLNQDDLKFYRHQNLKQCKQIANILDEFGYIVDVADISSRKIYSPFRYDLILSHKYDLQLEEILLTSWAKKIYLSTGLNHYLHNINVKKRYDLLQKRKNCIIKNLYLNSENMSFVSIADAIMGFGNKFTMATWKQNFNIKTFPINNYGYKDIKYLDKNFNKAKKNFLYFGSLNQLGKGLDLLLEIFSRNPNLNLYVCSNFMFEKDFVKCYKKELYNTPNIYPIGWISVNSEDFSNIVKKTAYVILPSCSEGQPGSVVNCMYAGLIPVVTKETGIDTEDFGITLPDDNLNTIEKTVLELANKDADWVKEKSHKTREIAINKFSEDAFKKRIREIFTSLKI